MKQTKYKINNTSKRPIVVSVMANQNGSVEITYDGLKKDTAVYEGLNNFFINPSSSVIFEMNTSNSYLVTTHCKHLMGIEGPIQYVEGNDLNSLFMGCHSLVKVSCDIFERNKDKLKMTKCFKDCVEFKLDEHNSKFFNDLPNIIELNETFANTGNVSLQDNLFPGEHRSMMLISTFKDNVYLEYISNRIFNNVMVSLINTFDSCVSLKTVHVEFIKGLNAPCTLSETFKDSGIELVDENILTYIPSNVTYNDLFIGCKCKVNKDFN